MKSNSGQTTKNNKFNAEQFNKLNLFMKINLINLLPVKRLKEILKDSKTSLKKNESDINTLIITVSKLPMYDDYLYTEEWRLMGEWLKKNPRLNFNKRKKTTSRMTTALIHPLILNELIREETPEVIDPNDEGSSEESNSEEEDEKEEKNVLNTNNRKKTTNRMTTALRQPIIFNGLPREKIIDLNDRGSSDEE